jgi:ATP-dependent helicase/nuclease subunit A
MAQQRMTQMPLRKMQFTLDQGAAIEPSSSIWVSASAGTGKTQVLTARVLRLLFEPGVQPENILCVTFTKAAAAEMQQRIFDTLARWVSMPDADLLDALREGLGVHQPEQKLDLARSLFAQTLDARGGLKIQTLHSFCQSLLTRFPLEAQLTPGFSTLEERTDIELQATALDAEIARAFSQSDKKFQNDITLLAQRIDDKNLLKTLRQLTTELAKSDAGQTLRAEQFEPQVRRLLELPTLGNAADYLAQHIGAIDHLPHIARVWMQGGVNNQKLAQFLLDWLACPTFENVQALQSAFLTKVGPPRKESQLGDNNAKKVDANITAKAMEAQTAVVVLMEKIKLFEIADQASAALRISWAVLQAVQETKNALGLVSFQDLIAKVAALLGSGAGDWVRYRLDDQISHVLVDEAQDTNADQWEILSCLTEEFFAGRGAREERTDNARTIFVVGDYKQSIFRFQGADPQVFGAEKEKLKARVAASGNSFAAVPLSMSFRSAPAIIEFVNHAITTLGAEQLGAGADFDQHIAHRAGEGGAVTLWPLTPYAKTDQDGDDLQAILDRPWEDSNERVTANRIARQIAAWLAPDSPHEVSGRKIIPADIMVLVRKRGKMTRALVQDLKNLGVPVAGADRMKLAQQLAVQDLLNLARFSLQPEDDLTLACVLKSPFFNWTDDQLFAVAHDRKHQSLWSALRDAASDAARATTEKLMSLLHLADVSTPFDFFSTVLEQALLSEQTGRAALFARLGRDVDDPVSMLLDEALNFDANHAPSLQAFVAWIATDDKELKRDPDAPRNEVRVMTVHGSKGLQAKIIILADSHGAPSPRETIALVGEAREALPLLYGKTALRLGPIAKAHEAETQAHLQDYWRLFYVAITRAEDQLYFAGWESGNSKASTSWYEQAHAVFNQLDIAPDTDSHWQSVHRFEIARTKGPETMVAPPGAARGIALPVWALTAAPAEPVPPRPLTPSQLGGEDQVVADRPMDRNHLARTRGTALHRLLELLPQIVPNRWETVARRLLAQTALPVESHADVLAQAFTVLTDPVFATVFGPGALAEVPVTAVLGKAVLSGQIDRLAVTATQVLVVDYKTTAQPPHTPADVPVAYVRQMAAYRLALQQIYPGHDVVAALLWTATPFLMPLPADLLDATAASFVLG